MRLIDADEFRNDILRQSELIKVDDFQVLPVVDVAECLDNAPTVKAIPIEWLERQLNVFGDGFYDLRLVIKQWEKENETM